MKRMVAISVLLLCTTAGMGWCDAVGNIDTAIHALKQKYPFLPSQLPDFSGYRQRDQRIFALENGFAASGLFPGKAYHVYSAADVQAINGRLNPGDQVILDGGTWQDQANITIRATGTAQKPILITSESGVRLQGSSSLNVYGSNIIIYGLKFIGDGTLNRGISVIRLGARLSQTQGDPCDNCIIDHVTIDNYDPITPTQVTSYVSTESSGDTIAFSTFTNKHSAGPVLSLGLPATGSQELDLYHNVFDGVYPPAPPGSTTYESGDSKFLQLGGGPYGKPPAYSIIEANTFSNYMNRNESVSLKTSNVIVKSNQFLHSEGGFHVSSADLVMIFDNTFDSHSPTDSTIQNDMGGVRLSGENHWVVHNTFIGLVNPRDWNFWPVTIEAGNAPATLPDPGWTLASQSNGDVIVDNVFQGCPVPTVDMGSDYGTANPPKTLLPTNIYFAGNTLRQSVPQTQAALDYDNMLPTGNADIIGPIFYFDLSKNYQNIVVAHNITE